MRYRKGIPLIELLIDNEGTEQISPALATILIQRCSVPEGDNDQRRRQRYHFALIYAIETGLHFEPDDFDELNSLWSYASDEDAYTAACESGNRSACLAYERHYNRKPMIIAGKRLHVGSEFSWNGNIWKVNSFTNLDGGLNATLAQKELPPRRLHLTWEMLHQKKSSKA